jgi:hypothetical protein
MPARPMKNVQAFLIRIKRLDLANLLEHSTYNILFKEGYFGIEELSIRINSPHPFSEALEILSPFDKKKIIDAIVSGEPHLKNEQHRLQDYDSASTTNPPIEGVSSLLPEVIIQRQLMIDVATGDKRIQEFNDYYIARQETIKELTGSISVDYKNPHDDLWSWYSLWKEKFASYKERRQYVYSLFHDLIQELVKRDSPLPVAREPTGWDRVDRAVSRARKLCEAAVNEEDFQAVGLVCREVLISLGQAVYDPEVHASIDGVDPSKTDASRMLEAYIHHHFSGASSKEVRAHAKAAINLALNLQHRRTATLQLAALCLEATSSTVAVIAIIAGRGAA